MIDWDARIERASALAAKYPFAAEILQFYAAIAGFQRDRGDFPNL